MSEWQPIDTLPCVGLFLFGRADIHYPVIGWNDSTRPHGIETEIGDIYFTPTHWMPLPEPPTR